MSKESFETPSEAPFQVFSTAGYPTYCTNNTYNFTEKDIENIKSEKKEMAIGNFLSDNTYILNEQKYSDIKKYINFHIERYTKDILRVSNDNEVYITQSWLNFSNPNMSHHEHSHPNSFISGIMYVQSNEQCPTVFVMKDNMFSITPKFLEWNVYNSGMQQVYQKPGGVILFPSTLRHMVPPFKGETTDTRITLSFNTYIKGKINVLNDKLTHIDL